MKGLLAQGRVLLDDNAEAMLWAKAYRRIHNSAVSELRIGPFRDDFIARLNDFISYNAQGAIDFGKQV